MSEFKHGPQHASVGPFTNDVLLPCYALALLQPSRTTGAFVGAQQPSGGTGEN